MSERVYVVHSTARELDRAKRDHPAALIQWAIRFCQEPEAFPVFAAWVRGIWPDCPFTDAEISESLRDCHNMMPRVADFIDSQT